MATWDDAIEECKRRYNIFNSDTIGMVMNEMNKEEEESEPEGPDEDDYGESQYEQKNELLCEVKELRDQITDLTTKYNAALAVIRSLNRYS